jgi:phosphatidate phosphatase APP1
MTNASRWLLLIWITLANSASAQSIHQSVQRDVGVGPDEHVVFVRSYGYPTQDGKTWNLLVSGRIWKGSGVLLGGASTSWLRATLGKARMLFVKDVRGRHLTIQVGGVSDDRRSRPSTLLGRQETIAVTSDEHGEFSGHMILSNDEVMRLSEQRGLRNWHITYGLAGSADKDSRSRIYLDRRSGISVVSDIDDTIKDSHIWSQTATIVHTLLPFKAIAGMADLYSAWSTSSDARFHYVSEGPDQMEKPIEHFLDSSGFPEGSVSLRVVSLKDKQTMQGWRGGNPCHFKIERISKILEDFPERQFCLIGDAGAGDKRALRWLASKYPDQVKWVFIRHLPRNVREDFIDPRRYETDYRCRESRPSVPRSLVYREFRTPSELAGLLPTVRHF